MKRSRGFTLLEALVALAVLAIALGAAARALGSAAGQSAALHQRLAAQWVAQDRLAEHRALGRWLALGRAQGEVEQAGQRLRWVEDVGATPNALFRRVDVRVYAAGQSQALAHASGFLARAAP